MSVNGIVIAGHFNFSDLGDFQLLIVIVAVSFRRTFKIAYYVPGRSMSSGYGINDGLGARGDITCE